MLDALEAYLGDGGRFMYLGGNSLFGVVTVDAAKPHRVEVRRWGAPWPFEAPPAERHHSHDRRAGRHVAEPGPGPNTIVGRRHGGRRLRPRLALPAQARLVRPARRASSSRAIEGELIGDSPNLQIQWGAAGYEYDRAEFELGTPATTLLLASSAGSTHRTSPMIDDELYFMQGRDGGSVGTRRSRARRTGSPLGHGLPRVPQRRRRLLGGRDLLARRRSPRTATTNTVSRVTENVLRRFADPDWHRPES